MSTRIRSASAVIAAAVAIAGFGSVTTEAAINYGDFAGSTVDFLNVTEDSSTDPVPPALYGTPTVSGDSIDFNPVSFNASATGAAGADATEGVLSMVMMSHAGHFIEQIQFEEAGEFALAGLSGNASVSVTGTFIVDILEVDGVGIGPINLSMPMTFTPSGGDFDLVSDGPGPAVNGTWSGSLMVDIQQALIDNNIIFTGGATKVSVSFDNTLMASSELGTSAFIAKKDIGGVGITVIPEPASIGLLIAGGLCMLGRRG